MIRLHELAPSNEMPVAHRLNGLIEAAWPDAATNPRDRIDLLVGVRTPTDVDILVILDLDRPREIPARPLRSGGVAGPSVVQRAIIAIEVKQLDSDRFDRIGNQLFPKYDGAGHRRSVAQQAMDAAYGVSVFAKTSGYRPFIFALAWLTEVDEAMLNGIEPMVIGNAVDWFGMLGAAAQQNSALHDVDNRETGFAVQVVRERLLNRRKESARDRARIERLTRDVASRTVVDDLVGRVGTAQISLVGRGGSGKTTSLALLAVRLAEAGERVLILTFHRTLRSDIAHLVTGLASRAGFPASKIQVETIAAFLLSALTDLGVAIPMNGDAVDYSALDALLYESTPTIVGAPDDPDGDAGKLRAANPDRFAWDYVLIDEAQDWSDSERDMLRALYGHRRLIIADGVDQLVRRQVACDWNASVPASERLIHRLDDSLRMLRNIATFANCTARALGLETWHIAPHDDLPGGRILIVSGDIETPEFVRAVIAAAASNKADAVDCLVCVPPSATAIGDDGKKRSRLAVVAANAGIGIWDGTEPTARSTSIDRTDVLRVVQYSSCRGLEGWITVAQDLDDFYLNKRKYPNILASDGEIAPDLVAKRSLMIPLTRAVHTLIISIRDPESEVLRVLREAASDPAMPRGVVEFVDAVECVARLSD